MPSAQQNSLGDNNPQIQEDLFRLLLDFKDYAIMMIDPAGNVMSWNLGAEHIYGYTEQEIIGKHISVFYPREEMQREQAEKILAIAKEKGRHETEAWKQRKDGSTFYANNILTAILNHDGSLKGFAKVTRDISLQKKLEAENKQLHEQLEEKVKQRTEELAVVNKELEAFSYSVSHDLRTPLRAISGYSMILKEDYETKLDDEGKRVINVIIENTKMMGNLIDDLLSFSRMSRLEVVYESIDMKKIVESCIADLLKTEAPGKYTFTVHALPTCKGDPNMLRQVWYNLVSNAIKYSSKKEQPQIEIGFVNDDKMNIYYVKDNGTGFDMKYYDKLFGVFQRLHRQDEFEGTGVGLALAKRIISKHLGQIWGEASLDRGATFYFSIPKQL